MTYEIYRYIFIGSAVLAGIMLAVTVVLFVVLRIPTVIGDLNGTNARRAIEDIRRRNENTGEKVYRSSAVNSERGKVTDKISQSGRIAKSPSRNLHGAMSTERLSDASPSAGTQLLSEAEKESIQDTTVILSSAGGENETTVLESPDREENTVAAFVVEYEIAYIPSNEIIEYTERTV